MTRKTVTEAGPEAVGRKQHLLQRGNRWYYNRAWPSYLKDKLSGSFRKSLRTESLSEALRAKGEAEREYWAAVDKAEAQKVTRSTGAPNDAQAKSLAIEFFRVELSGLEEPLAYAQRSPDRLGEQSDLATEKLADLKRQLAEDNGGAAARAIANKIAVEAGYENAGWMLPRLVQRARIASTEVWQGKLVADYGARPGDLLFASAMQSPQEPVGSTEKATPELTLSALIAAYKAAKWEDFTTSTQTSYAKVFKTLQGVLGENLSLAKIDRQKARRFFDAIRGIPKGYGKGKKWEGVGPLEAVEMGSREKLQTLSATTINDTYMVTVSSLFRWAEEEELVPSNPFKGLKVKDKEAAKDKRDPFTLEQIATLFNGEPWASDDRSPDGRPSRYWFPLIALFQGMRRGEIAQLETAAFFRQDGVDVMELRGDLKNANAYRTLPVHPELKRLGLLQFVSERRRAKEPMLFDEKPNSRGQWARSVGDWFAKLVKSHGFEGRGLGLHSFRHSFEDALRRADLHGTAIGAALTGRASAEPVAGAYGKGFAAGELYAALVKVTYPQRAIARGAIR